MKRYNVGHKAIGQVGQMWEDEAGNWVKYEDLKQLQEEVSDCLRFCAWMISNAMVAEGIPKDQTEQYMENQLKIFRKENGNG